MASKSPVSDRSYSETRPMGSERAEGVRSTVIKEGAYAGTFLSVDIERVCLPDREPFELEMIRHPGAAAVVPVDDEGNVILVRQYRHAAGGYILEIPAGKLDRDTDGNPEPPLACAKRELEEETGYRAERFTPMGFIYTTPGFTDEIIWLFLAEGLSQGQQKLERDEVLTVKSMPLSSALDLALSGGIEDGKTVAGLTRAARLAQKAG